MHFDEEFMIAVERKFMKFMAITTNGIRKDYFRELMYKAKKEISIYDIPIEATGSLIEHDIMFDKEFFQVDDENLIKALNTLTQQQKDILLKIFIEQRKQAEIAKMFKISQQRVSKIKSEAVKKIIDFYKGD